MSTSFKTSDSIRKGSQEMQLIQQKEGRPSKGPGQA